MSANRLNDDLIQDFKEQKELITAQIKIFEPIAASLSKPAAVRLAKQGTLIIFEILCYLLFIGTIAVAIMINIVYPFYILKDLSSNSEIVNRVGVENVLYFNFAIYGLIILVGLLFLVIGINMSSIRRKNKILSVAGKNLKILVGQHLKRKAAIDAIEQRHFMELPGMQAGQRVNEVPNPGYGG